VGLAFRQSRAQRQDWSGPESESGLFRRHTAPERVPEGPDFLLDRNHHVRVSVAAEARAFEASFPPASLAAVFAQAVSALARLFASVVESAAGAAARAVVFAAGPRAAVAVVALAVVSAALALASCAIVPALAGVSSPTEDSWHSANQRTRRAVR
jgi:hypothetical protein